MKTVSEPIKTKSSRTPEFAVEISSSGGYDGAHLDDAHEI